MVLGKNASFMWLGPQNASIDIDGFNDSSNVGFILILLYHDHYLVSGK